MLFDGDASGQRLVRRELLLRRQHRRLRRRDAALRGGELRGGVIELFLADRAGGHQRQAARYVVLSTRQIAPGARQFGFAQGDLRLERAVVSVERAHFAHRLRELRLGLVERNLGVGRIELDEQLPGLHVVGVVGVDRDHRAADLRSELHHVALHVGVVGGFEMVQYQRPVDAIGDAGDRDGGGHGREGLLAGRVAWRRGVGFRGSHEISPGFDSMLVLFGVGGGPSAHWPACAVRAVSWESGV